MIRVSFYKSVRKGMRLEAGIPLVRVTIFEADGEKSMV